MPEARPAKEERSPRPPTRERLIRAGLGLFQMKGYAATGLTEILERAGAPKGSFYHHFPAGKEALAIAALEWLTREILDHLDHLEAEGCRFDGLLLGLAAHMADGLRKPDRMRGSLYTILAQETVPHAPAVAASLEKATDQLLDRLTTADMAAGTPRDQALTHARLGLAVLDGATIQARVTGQPDLVSRLVGLWLMQSGLKR